MANNTYPTKDEVVYRRGVGMREYSYFNDMFYIKQVREGVEILATKSHKQCHYEVGNYYVHNSIDFQVNPVKGKTLDIDLCIKQVLQSGSNHRCWLVKSRKEDDHETHDD